MSCHEGSAACTAGPDLLGRAVSRAKQRVPPAKAKLPTATFESLPPSPQRLTSSSIPPRGTSAKSIRARLLPPLRSAPLAKQAGASATLLRSSLFSTPPPRQPLPPLVAVSPDPIRSHRQGNSASKCAPNPARPLPRSRQPVRPRNPGRLRSEGTVPCSRCSTVLLAMDSSQPIARIVSPSIALFFFLATDHPYCSPPIARILQEGSPCGFRL